MDNKKYRDKNTGKVYYKHDGILIEVVDENSLDLEEVGAENLSYRFGYSVHTDKTVNGIKNTIYNLKDTLEVPIGDRKFTFVVEHVNHSTCYDDVYFVSKDIINKFSMKDIDDALDLIENMMPQELVNIMKPIEHVIETDGVVKRYCRKVNLLSLANLRDADNHTGDDDILFDGLKDEASRCKNLDGQTYYWWLRSPNLGNTTKFWVVSSGGALNYSNASNVGGGVPCFSIRVYKRYDF